MSNTGEPIRALATTVKLSDTLEIDRKTRRKPLALDTGKSR